MTDVALVTGASTGIGRELARVHAERGCDLVVVPLNQRLMLAAVSLMPKRMILGEMRRRQEVEG